MTCQRHQLHLKQNYSRITVFIQDNQQPARQQRTTKDLTSLEILEGKWQMSFNPSKCTVIIISPNEKEHLTPTSYHLHDQTLETEDDSKYLRVTITTSSFEGT